jgi:hypothetical protein
MSEVTWQTPTGGLRQTLTAVELPDGGARLTIVYAPHLPDEPTPTVDLDAAVRQELAAAVARLHGAMLAGDGVRRPGDPVHASYSWHRRPHREELDGEDLSQVGVHWKVGREVSRNGYAGVGRPVLDVFIASRTGHTYSVWLETEQVGELAAWLAGVGAPERLEA